MLVYLGTALSSGIVSLFNPFSPPANSVVVPTFSGNFTASVAERSTAVGTFTVSADGGEAVVYTKTGTDASFFTIDSSTGVVAFATAPDYEAPADAGANNVYNFNVVATNSAGSSSATATITVTDIADVPAGMPATANFNVAENSTTVGTVVVSTGTAPIVYTLTGTDAAKFNINSSTGAVTFVTAPDYETPTDSGTNNVYNFNVVGTNTYGNSATAVAVTVTDVADSPVVMPTSATFNVAENTTAVGSVVANSGSPTIVYTITGADVSKFSINSSTGVLAFLAAPNYEVPTDVGTNNVYNVNVVGTNSFGNSSTAVAVTVTNVADDAPVMTPSISGSIPENTTIVGTVTASAGTAPITYTLTGTDAARFAINSSSGAVTFNPAPDYEVPTDVGANNVYNFNVVATNAFGNASTAVTMTVTNVADDTVVMPAPASFNVAENTTAVGTIVATSGTAPITYSLTGVDASKFSVNSSTGVLVFNPAPDYEVPTDSGANNVYNVNVVGTNAFGNAATAVTVTVTNVADVPATMPANASFNVVENTTAVGTVVASSGTAPITYTLTGTDAAKFSIVSSTGVLTFATAPDYETPTDSGTNNVYNFNVVGTNTFGNSATAVAVTVTDVTDNPIVMPANAAFNVNENNTAVGSVTATSGTTPIYTLTGSDANKFNINSSSGVITFITAPDFESPTDTGTNNVYNFNVVGSNAYGPSGSTAVAVTVVDVNENIAVVMPATGSYSVAENTTAIGAAPVATAGTTPIVYTITGPDAARVSIVSGNLVFNVAPDYEAPADVGGDNVYNFNVVGTNNSGANTASTAMTITVTNVADVPVAMAASASFNVNENTSTVGTVAVTAGTSPTYSLTGVDANKFSVNSSTGALSFITPPDFETPTDVGADNVYNVNVVASNAFGPSASTAVTVTVVDATESVAVVMPATASYTISEGTTAIGVSPTATAGSAPIVYSLSGADASLVTISSGNLVFITAPDYEVPTDTGGNNVYNFNVVGTNNSGANTSSTAITVTVTDVADIPVSMPTNATFNVAENSTAVGTVVALSGTTPSYALSGTDASFFTIDSSTGVVAFATAPDYEAPADAGANNVYNFNVVGSNAFGANATTAVAVTVTDVNENVAVVMPATAAFNINENITAIGTAPVATAGTAPIVYTLTGPDASLVSLSNGLLAFLVAPDYEAPGDVGTNNVYNFNVVGTNNSGANTASTAVTVTIGNVNENVVPVIASTQSYSVNENNTVIGTLTATSGTAPITYSVSGTDANRITVNSTTGALTFTIAPDYENPTDVGANNVYNFNVTANNVTGTPAVCAVTVTVVNVYEDLTPGTITFTPRTNATPSTQYQAIADITSVEVGAPVTFSNCELSTDGGTTWVTTGTPPYVLGSTKARATVTSSDTLGQQTFIDAVVLGVTGRFTVTNQAAPSVTAPEYTGTFNFTVQENTTSVGTVTAPIGTSPISYALSGVDANKFVINSSTGVVTFVSAPDYETPTDVGANNVYNVSVTATNSGGAAVAAIVVTVGNVIEDSTPTDISLTNIANAAISTYVESPIQTVAGMEVQATTALTLTGLQVAVNTGTGFGAWLSSAPSLSVGNTFKLRVMSSSSYETPVSGTYVYGGVSHTWTVTTAAADLDIDAIVLGNHTLEAGLTYTSVPYQVLGATPGIDLPISVTNGMEYSINRGSGYEPFTASSGVIQNGNYFRVRRAAPTVASTSQTPQTVTGGLTISTFSATLTLTASLANTVPRIVFLGSRSAQAPNVEVFSDIATIADLSLGVTITVTAADGSLAVDTGSGLGSFVLNGSAVLENGDRFQVKHTTPSTPGSVSTTVVQYGSRSTAFTSSTSAADDSLNTIIINDRINVIESTQVISNEITVGGVNVPQAISVIGCLYSVNGGSYTAVPGVVLDGDKLLFKAQSSSVSEGRIIAAINIGRNKLKWSIVTREYFTKPKSVELMPKVNQALDTPTIMVKKIERVSSGIMLTATNAELTNDNGATWTTSSIPMVVGMSYFRVTVEGSSDYYTRTVVSYTICGIATSTSAITLNDPDQPRPVIESAGTRASKHI